MSDIIIITIADEDYVESWFSDSQSSNEKASQTFAVRSKTDKSSSTNKTHFLDVHAIRHQLENVVRVKHERKARTQFPKREKTKRNRCKKSHRASRLLPYKYGYDIYYPIPCLIQGCRHIPCICPTLTCKECSHSI